MRWAPVRNYVGYYEVSDTGLVRRVGRSMGAQAGKILRGYVEKRGYIGICIQKDDVRRRFRIHRLVYEAFHGPIPEGMEINHIDCDKSNNALSNLEAVTHQANVDHATAHNLRDQLGERNSCSKLTADMVRELRRLYRPGVDGSGYLTLSRRFGVTHSTVANVVTGKTWAHLA